MYIFNTLSISKTNRIIFGSIITVALLTGITLQAQPVITQQPTNQTIINGSNALFSVSVTGSGPFLYQWQFNSNNLPKIAIINTIAGNGTNGFSGDNGSATNAEFHTPSGLAYDFRGNLYVADTYNNRIRKIDTNGIITTVAGYGASYYSGDGGYATNAALASPQGVTIDSNGNLLISDTGNNRIRRVDTNGIITTMVGSRGGGYSGDGGAATNCELYNPFNVSTDSKGVLYISDAQNNRIRKVDTNGIITTFAGNGVPFSSGDGGNATNASIYYPVAVAVDNAGNVYIEEQQGNKIRKVDTNGIITTIAGNGTSGFSGDGGYATNAELNTLDGLAVDNAKNIYIADSNNGRVREINAQGLITTITGDGAYIGASTGNGSAATNAHIGYAYGVAVDAAGNLYVSHWGGVSKVSPSNLPTLALTNVSNASVGAYAVVISSASGSVTSSVAYLAVVPGQIVQQPQSQSCLESNNIVFSVAATGPGVLTYQWFFINTNYQAAAGAVAQALSGFVYGALVTNSGAGYTTVPNVTFTGGGGSGAKGTATVSNGAISAITITNAGSGYIAPPYITIDPPNGLLIGKTNTSLNLNLVTTNIAGSYYVVVSNVFGIFTSTVATLNVLLPSAKPSISQQPLSCSACLGNNVGFSAIASGTTPLNYQWWETAVQQVTAGAIPITINGFVLAANITNNGAGYLTVPAVQFVGGSGSGAAGYATVSNCAVTIITVTNAGSGYSTPPTIQIPAPSAISLAGQTNSILSLWAVTNSSAANYFVVVTNNYGSVTSSVASLTVFLPPQAFTAINTNKGKLKLNLSGTPSYPYILQTATNLTQPINWIPVLTNLADTNGNWSITVTNMSQKISFYRAAAQ